MANEENGGVDLAARDAAQLEAAQRIADETVNDDGGRRFNLNRPLIEDQFENAVPRPRRSLGDYTRPVYNQGLSSVRPPPITANNFELKQGLLQTMQNNCIFRGKVNEDPNTYLMDFEEIMNTFQYNGVSKDAVYLRAFPFLLKDDVKQWLHSLPTCSIRTWEYMTKKFLDKYFLAAKTRKFRREIHNFCQNEIETIFKAWERFKELDFWDGLTSSSRRTLNTACGGPLMKKLPEEVVLILDELSEDANQWPAKSNDRRKSVEVHQVDSNTSMQAQLDNMAKEIRKLTLAKQNNPRPQCQGPPGFQNQQRQQYQQQQPNQSCMEDLMKAFINKTDEKFETRSTTIQNLERQMGQIANLLSDRAPGTLPYDTKKNPKETIKDVSLRRGKTLVDPVVKARTKVVNKKTETPAKKKSKEQKDQSSGVQKEIEESRHMPALPFPQKMKREKLDKCFGRFLEMLKQLYVNIPFMEVLTQMPAYAKFLKEILSSKRKLEEKIVVKLNAHCSAILQNKIPQKCGDPGSFTIPCSLGSEKFDKALCDSSTFINLIHLSVFRKLEGEIEVIKSIPMSLQLADQTTILPEGIIEDILVRVNKFVFPVDFIVVDMEVNKEVPLILGSSFLCTGRAILDIYEGLLMLRVGNKKVVFQMKMMMKYPTDEVSTYSCFKLDVVGELAEKYKFDKLVGDTLERCITQSSTMEDEDPKIKKEVEALETEDQVVDEEELKEEASKPNVELKVLPTHLKYTFLETNNFSVIISADLTGTQE
uniref:Retrotransposon gag domain-containing protein n=1 Tax=Nicotiana tabacum TaxID=4097 RepID=A0A1S4CXL0_TOBAC|nr:PREDICTED: uncharacterized protein LOC107823586 [Nicotiana tabacum]